MTGQDKFNIALLSILLLFIVVQIGLLVWAVAIGSAYIAFQSGCVVITAGQFGMCCFNWRSSR